MSLLQKNRAPRGGKAPADGERGGSAGKIPASLVETDTRTGGHPGPGPVGPGPTVRRAPEPPVAARTAGQAKCRTPVRGLPLPPPAFRAGHVAGKVRQRPSGGFPSPGPAATGSPAPAAGPSGTAAPGGGRSAPAPASCGDFAAVNRRTGGVGSRVVRRPRDAHVDLPVRLPGTPEVFLGRAGRGELPADIGLTPARIAGRISATVARLATAGADKENLS